MIETNEDIARISRHVDDFVGSLDSLPAGLPVKIMRLPVARIKLEAIVMEYEPVIQIQHAQHVPNPRAAGFRI
jgi:hypothetical protein